MWRTLFNKALCAAIAINQFNHIKTKVYFFGRQMIAHEKFLKKKKPTMIDEAATRLKKYQINPLGGFKRFWDITIVCLLLYTATYSPFRTAFMDDTYSEIFFIFELCVDSLFFIDIIVTFLTPVQLRDSEFEYDSKQIAQMYLLGPFFIDIIAVFPTWAFEGGE
jgi:hypothetical protein